MPASTVAADELESLRTLLLTAGQAVADAVRRVLLQHPVEERIAVAHRAGSDVIYAIDQAAEEALVGILEREAAAFGGIVLVAEGIGDQEITCWPRGQSEAEARWRFLVDPIDGTRGIMYDKRPAFFLAGAAPNRGEATCLSDIQAAVLCEIPTSRMYLADHYSAIRGRGVTGLRRNLLDGSTEPQEPRPNRSRTIRGGFAQLCRFFTPGKALLAEIEEELLEVGLFPGSPPGEILAFEDQYISTGGQLYEMLTGKDRFIADIRASLYAASPELRPGHVCHPYDMAALLVAEEAGLIVTSINGSWLDAPFDTLSAVDWIAYANSAIREEVEPRLRRLMEARGWPVSQQAKSPAHS